MNIRLLIAVSLVALLNTSDCLAGNSAVKGGGAENAAPAKAPAKAQAKTAAGRGATQPAQDVAATGITPVPTMLATASASIPASAASAVTGSGATQPAAPVTPQAVSSQSVSTSTTPVVAGSPTEVVTVKNQEASPTQPSTPQPAPASTPPTSASATATPPALAQSPARVIIPGPTTPTNANAQTVAADTVMFTKYSGTVALGGFAFAVGSLYGAFCYAKDLFVEFNSKALSEWRVLGAIVSTVREELCKTDSAVQNVVDECLQSKASFEKSFSGCYVKKLLAKAKDKEEVAAVLAHLDREDGMGAFIKAYKAHLKLRAGAFAGGALVATAIAAVAGWKCITRA